MVRKARWDYYNKLKYKKLTDNKTFRRTLKPFSLTRKLAISLLYSLKKVKRFLMIKRHGKN